MMKQNVIQIWFIAGLYMYKKGRNKSDVIGV